MNHERVFDRLRVSAGTKVRLRNWDPAETLECGSRDELQDRLEENLKRLFDLQYALFAENRRSVLVVLQGMDAGGKDGTIRHVISAFNPQGCRVTSFKAPAGEEAAHDFLWRVHRVAPARGEVGVFNRSHYEDVLVVRVRGLAPRGVWGKRFQHINEFERMLADHGVTVLKFYLHISKGEQKKRLLERTKDPTKLWKANPMDFDDRRYWDQYMKAYEDVLSTCSTEWAPWFIIPADHKWFRNYAVSEILVRAMQRLDLRIPKPKVHTSFAE